MAYRLFSSLVVCAACSAQPKPALITHPGAPPPSPLSASAQVLVPETEPAALPIAPLASVPTAFAEPHATSNTPSMVERPAPPLKKRWSAKVGRTTFRTTMAMTPQGIVIGTHGTSLEQANEKTDGVYVLAPQTGKLVRFIATPGGGDKDVGGIAVDGANVVFGADNAQVVKVSLSSGATLWRAASDGKVRPAPALGNLNAKGALDVVVGDEAGDLHAFDGDDGRALWTKQTGENDYEARGFIAAAALADLNADGIDDVIAGARDGVLVAYDGRDGAELWRVKDGSGIHGSPSIVDVDADGRLEVLATWSYSTLSIFDAATGTERYRQLLEQDTGGIEGLFGSPVLMPGPTAAAPGFIVQGTAWWGGHRRGGKKAELVDGVVLATQSGRAFRSNEGRVSSTAVVLDLLDDGVWDAVIGTEDRELVALAADGTRRMLATLGGAIEAPALVTDVDADGSFELLVASNDGLLTCFETGSRVRPLLSRFRGDSSDNRGHLASVNLGFVRQPSPNP